MRFELVFEALHIYFVQISYLKKYIPGSQTALVSCKNINWLGPIKQLGLVYVIIKSSWRLMGMISKYGS